MGSPVFCLYYRADLLEKIGRQPPQTWAEYLELARLLKEKGPAAPFHATMEPLGRGWAALVFLAHAAPYAKHPNHYSALFDIETMEPLVAAPPMVRALEELVESAKLGPAEQFEADPSAVRAAFWQGKCGMAMTWPTAARQAVPEGVAKGVRIGFAELPGSSQVFNLGAKAWEARPEGTDAQVPLLSVQGRVGLVHAGLDRPGAALELLGWLSGSQRGGIVCGTSPATTLVRRSQTTSPQDWVEKPVPASAAGAYAALTARTLSRQQSVSALPLPGRAEYIEALDEAVRSAVGGGKSPAQALEGAAARWREITRRLGVDAQKTAYQHSLGL